MFELEKTSCKIKIDMIDVIKYSHDQWPETWARTLQSSWRMQEWMVGGWLLQREWISWFCTGNLNYEMYVLRCKFLSLVGGTKKVNFTYSLTQHMSGRKEHALCLWYFFFIEFSQTNKKPIMDLFMHRPRLKVAENMPFTFISKQSRAHDQNFYTS